MRFQFKAFIVSLVFLFGGAFADTFVAVLETLSPEGAINRDQCMFLTDKLRERANLVLPAYMGYSIMTRENINAMLPPGKTIEECIGSCIAETGRNISANYVANARVGKFGSQLTITVQLYETKGNKLLGSFTDRKPNPDGLLSSIEKNADALFMKIQADVNGSTFRSEKTSMQKVQISTEPTGVLLSVDGKPLKSCVKTPCTIDIPLGNHQFSFVMDEYFDKDTAFEIESSTRKIYAKMVPNFGTLRIAPNLTPGVGSIDDLEIEIDGKKRKGESFRLPIGNHSVKLTHPCYNWISFEVGTKSGSELLFERNLRPINAGLSLSAKENSHPTAVPVYVANKPVGKTPFQGEVPFCADIKVQYQGTMQPVGVKLRAGEYIGYQHDVSSGRGHNVDRLKRRN